MEVCVNFSLEKSKNTFILCESYPVARGLVLWILEGLSFAYVSSSTHAVGFCAFIDGTTRPGGYSSQICSYWI